MFAILKNKNGQGLTVQYALTFFFIVAVVVSMTVYFKRTLQGRIRDATVYMALTVHNDTGKNVQVQYEPYYSQSTVDRFTVSGRTDELLSSFNASSGIFVGEDSSSVVGSVVSNQAPPALAR